MSRNKNKRNQELSNKVAIDELIKFLHIREQERNIQIAAIMDGLAEAFPEKFKDPSTGETRNLVLEFLQRKYPQQANTSEEQLAPGIKLINFADVPNANT